MQNNSVAVAEVTQSPDKSTESNLTIQNQDSNQEDSASTIAVNRHAAKSEDAKESNPARPRGADGEVLSESEISQIDSLKRRDIEVRRHENAHLAAAGGYATGGAHFEYSRGPDGRNYAVGG
ncbi:MAG: hypothetical protein JXA52_02550, partial [Planctomycetes bacterium]|nr:hypothetical protein [Planctomycetota bacterium]